MIKRNCKMCEHYKPEEVGDSDYGAVYADKPSCSEYFDIDQETSEELKDFDREIERSCCVLDFWKVLEVDNNLHQAMSEEMRNPDATGSNTYNLFKSTYNL